MREEDLEIGEIVRLVAGRADAIHLGVTATGRLAFAEDRACRGSRADRFVVLAPPVVVTHVHAQHRSERRWTSRRPV